MSQRLVNWFKFASPASFYPLAGKMWPWFAAIGSVLAAVGLWISFYPFTQAEYLAIVAQWLRSFGVAEDAIAAARHVGVTPAQAIADGADLLVIGRPITAAADRRAAAIAIAGELA